MEAKKKTVAQLVTEQVIKGLEQGDIPWQRPWHSFFGGNTPAANLFSKRPYRGVNVLLAAMYCEMYEYPQPLFASELQIRAKGGKVKKGEKPHLIVLYRVYPKMVTNPKTDQPERKLIFILKEYQLYNLAQTTLDAKKYGYSLKLSKKAARKVRKAEELFMLRKPAVKVNGGERACYNPKTDLIQMPARKLFKDTESYYGTAYHELVHWSGHDTRLNRFNQPDSKIFGSESYSEEELVAEIGANMMSIEIGTSKTVTKNSQAYINGWIKGLRKDPRMIIVASNRAQRAYEWLSGKVELPRKKTRKTAKESK